ncbi:aspartate--tRNA ligase [Mycoplasma elephantis]|uniref:aspartate--tRNA ligase n=1 Tax=Mycoplasma elephantis TaxID=114882 RepID=UPI00048663E0|nr:aspartate--tRNA ligase [Mycoplasma elephantis]
MKTINNNEITLKHLGKELTVYGWVQNKRRFGKKTFIDLRDRSGIVQLVFDNIDLHINKEAVLKATGKVIKRIESNKEINSGDIEILVNTYDLLSDSNELPFSIRDDNNVSEDLRIKYRYLDLRRPTMQKNIILRAKVISIMRNYLSDQDFIEIETPILGKSTPEGARDYLVPTRHQGKFFALPQSPQLFKQLLMASGFERYYQVAKVFRDEDSRKDRQPEFTQFDIEASFMTKKHFQEHIEKMMKKVFLSIGQKLKTPFRRISYNDAINDYGSDKPDLRYDNKITTIEDWDRKSGFEIISKQESIRMIHIPDIITNNEFKIFEEVAKKNGANILWYITHENNEIIKSNFAVKDKENSLKIIEKCEKMHYGKGTIFIVANTYMNTSISLGAVRIKANELFNYAKDTYEFAWVEDWPMFEYDEESKRYVAMHHPFTNFEGDIDNVDITKMKSQAYDLVLNGYEIAGGSVRIHKKEIQQKMFNLIKLTDEEVKNKFGFFIDAFNYGLPPHLGMAFGIDRLIMIMTKSSSIRDVIAFPKNANGYDLLTGSPSEITKEQLDEVFLRLKEIK